MEKKIVVELTELEAKMAQFGSEDKAKEYHSYISGHFGSITQEERENAIAAVDACETASEKLKKAIG